jgi:hypothetical protein
MKVIIAALILAFYILSIIGFTSAIIINSVDLERLYPGQSANLKIEIKNTLNEDAEDVTLRLNLAETFFTTIGASEDNVDAIDKDDDEKFNFEIKAPSNLKPGDYNIPYTIRYIDENDDEQIKNGSFGITVGAKTEIDFAVETQGENSEVGIVGQKGKLTLEIINKGLGDLKSVSVEIFPQGYELLSKDKIFVGSIDAEDSDIVSFDIIFDTKNPILSAKISFKDFENNPQVETVNFPLEVYTIDEALAKGLIAKSNTMIYIGIATIVIILWIIYGQIKKRRRKNKHKEGR